MMITTRWTLLAAASIALSACRSAPASGAAALTPAQMSMRDGGIPPYTAGDVTFMQGMIGHHAQAVRMSAFAEPNTSSSDVRVLAGRIAVSQTDEIAFMQNWLRDRRQSVPDTSAGHAHHDGMSMPGMTTVGGESAAMMPGMLTTAQMDTLARATGLAFDFYFLTYMIQHHRGAIDMVDDLMAIRGAANDDNVFKFVSDVVADQSTEIARMQLMLKTRPRP